MTENVVSLKFSWFWGCYNQRQNIKQTAVVQASMRTVSSAKKHQYESNAHCASGLPRMAERERPRCTVTGQGLAEWYGLRRWWLGMGDYEMTFMYEIRPKSLCCWNLCDPHFPSSVFRLVISLLEFSSLVSPKLYFLRSSCPRFSLL